MLESDPPRRLAYTWHTFTPRVGDQVGIDDETLAASPPSLARRSLRRRARRRPGPLTVVHSDFLPGSTVLEMVGTGWPRLLSDLKSLLEADEV